MGVHFAIDDFGTGYSSLSALKNLPVARLKIDQSFVRNLAHDENDRGIAAAVISLGQRLNMRVIAEGVETDEQLAFLRDNHCDEIQGYHFSKPIRSEGERERRRLRSPLRTLCQIGADRLTRAHRSLRWQPRNREPPSPAVRSRHNI